MRLDKESPFLLPTPLLRNTFVHVRGIGYATEQKLWDSGVTNWEAFLEAPEQSGLGPARTDLLEKGVLASMDELEARNHEFFRDRLPVRECWRAYGEFGDSVAYLDIETTGMESTEDEVTIIGLYDGSKMRTYLAGEGDFVGDLDRYSLLVTYNGSSFDLPFLRRAFPDLRFHQLHIDLRYALARLGLTGGLKAIERRMGLQRSPDTRHLGGWDAVYLWQRHQQGDDQALETLIRYNQEDVENLEPLLEMAYDALRGQATGQEFRTYSLRDLENHRNDYPDENAIR